MAYFALLYDYVDNAVEKRAPHRPAHLELYRRWREEGKLVMGGALGDPPHSALIVFDVDSADAVDEFAEADPYVQNGVVTARRIEPWAVVS